MAHAVLLESIAAWQIGWTAGLGMEFALTDRWSAKAEYSHYELGRDTFTTFVGDPGRRAKLVAIRFASECPFCISIRFRVEMPFK